ncbi:MAG: helix-turn-helix transcriptional regulator [Lentisphaeria bacterium]|nr:helix-turn-helix transcriptional regulator [Lentisphaeria bacterium]
MRSVFQDLRLEILSAREKMLDTSWRTENFDRRYRIVPHTRFYLPLSGEAFYDFRGRHYAMRRGVMQLLPPFAEVKARCDGECYLGWINFHCYIGEDMIDVFSLWPVPWELPVDDQEYRLRLFRIIRRCVGEAKHAFREIPPGALFEAEAALRLLIHPFLEQIERAAPRQADPGRLLTLLRYIDDHLDRSLTLGHLAGVMHCHPNYLAAQFSRRMGQSLGRYCRMRKFDRAVELLNTTEMNIAEIADALGYADVNNFSRQFRGCCGLSPRNYRRTLPP